MPTRNVSLTAEADAFVERLVKAGEYQNASEAICDALRVFQQKREEDSLKLWTLRAQIEAGLAALERGDFIEISDMDLDGYLEELTATPAKSAPDAMTRFRLSRIAQADLALILAPNAERWGIESRRHYAAILVTAIRKVAANPESPTQARAELAPMLRSLHIQDVRAHRITVQVMRPVHILYYRTMVPAVIEIVRILHERMEPSRHLRESSEDRD